MLSRHGVFAPRVAEPPAFQYTAALAPLSMAFAAESGALSGVRGRREAQAAPALPSLSSARSRWIRRSCRHRADTRQGRQAPEVSAL